MTRRESGAVATEFVLVLPWIVLLLLAFVWLGVRVVNGHLETYRAFREARGAAVYHFRATPSSDVPGIGWMPALEGEKGNLDGEGDNPVPYCGRNGRYRLCF